MELHNTNDEGGTSALKRKSRSHSPEPSCVSMKSNNSMIIPPGVSAGGNDTEPKLKKPRSHSPETSCVSMKSNNSMIIPPGFSAGGKETDLRLPKARAESPEHSYVSMKSNNSMIIPPGFSAAGNRTDTSCGIDGQHQKQSRSELVSSTSGHTFCSQCETSFWGHMAPSGDVVCPQCRKTSSPSPIPHLLKASMEQTSDNFLHRILERHKTSMKTKYESLFEGINAQENKTFLNQVYTQLYIIEGDIEGVNEEHEVLCVEKTQRKHLQNAPINCLDIFKPVEDSKIEMEEESIEALIGKGLRLKEREENGPLIRSVLTKGIAGIGKTVSVQKYILDWAEGKANQDIDFMFVLPFRELNLIKEHLYSLCGLLSEFHPELKDLDPKTYDQHKAVFIFDGLDESRIPLHFSQCEKVSDITTESSVDVLMTNLIKGELLPNAQIWITSRPAAASQIPRHYISRMTEIQGFNNPQKEEYFRKRICDQEQAKSIITHIKTTRSLYIMCYIPVFCWITATVLQQIVKQCNKTEIPKTLTEMYSHFLLTQANMKNKKYAINNEQDPHKLLESNRAMLLKLAELAFNQLIKRNVMFYEEDLKECDIDVTEASVYSGIFTEIFREECVLYHKKVYCFVHLSFQEFLAALYVLHCHASKKMEKLQFFNPSYSEVSENIPLDNLLEKAVDKALKSKNGHLDLFLRFLLGISLETNQRLLKGLLTNTQHSSENISEYIKNLLKENEDENRFPTIKRLSPERSINLFLCLSEMKDQSLSREIEEYLKSKKYSDNGLSPGQCSALACMLLVSEEVKDELDLKKYEASEEGYIRLISAVTVCRKALLDCCSLNSHSCESISSALQSPNSFLKELDISNNNLLDSGAKLLSEGLKSSHCKLETLRLAFCNLEDKACDSLGSALQSENSSLKELDLSNNDLQDSGVELLSSGLKSSNCKLEILRLSGCMVTGNGCFFLASALKSDSSRLRELDLTYNHPGESGVKELSDLLKDPACTLKELKIEHGGEIRMKPRLMKYACKITLDPNTAHRHLFLSEGNRKVEFVEEEQPYPDHPERFDGYEQVLCVESLTGRCYWEAEWSGFGNETVAAVALAYKSISRKGRSDDSEFGTNEKSWSLECSMDMYYARHDDKQTDPSPPQSPCSSPSLSRSASPCPPPRNTRRIGVYLDWPAGTLSFYSVNDKHELLRVFIFQTTFTEPHYAGFWVDKGASVRVCEI